MSPKTLPRIILAVLAAVLVFAGPAASQTASPAKHHTVFPMNEPETAWPQLMAHASNLINALDKDGGVEVEIVFFGEGINQLRKTNERFAGSMKALAGRGVIFAACQNSMRSRGIKSDDLFPFVREVDSGVAELTRKQEAGWAYIYIH